MSDADTGGGKTRLLAEFALRSSAIIYGLALPSFKRSA